MSSIDQSIVRRWRGRLAVRQALAVAARKRYIWHPTSANRAKLAHRREQVQFAQRVIARHVGGAPSVAYRAAAFIAGFEGGQSADGLFHPYWDPDGRVWTIGYGHTHGVTSASRPLTLRQARALLADDLARVYMPPVLKLRLPHSNMVVAVTSLVFNCGVGLLDPSHTIGAALHRRDWKAAGAAFTLYDRAANGAVLLGLLLRRKAEQKLFTS